MLRRATRAEGKQALFCSEGRSVSGNCWGRPFLLREMQSAHLGRFASNASRRPIEEIKKLLGRVLINRDRSAMFALPLRVE